MMVFFAVVIDEAAEPDPADGRRRKKMPATIPVASTDLVSRNTQKVTANQTVKLMTETRSVFTSRCGSARAVLLLRSSARVLVVDMRKRAPVSRSHGLDLPRLPDASAPS